jgi:hypothetical protein
MTAEMPERIWAYQEGPGSIRRWAKVPTREDTEYVRADVASLADDALTPAYMLGFEKGKEAAASTHTRALLALEEAEKGVESRVAGVGRKLPISPGCAIKRRARD